MVTCEYCGKQAEASLGTCPSCGAPLPAEPVQETPVQTSSADTTSVSDATATAAALIGALVASGAAHHKDAPPRPHPGDLPQMHPERSPAHPAGKRPFRSMNKRGPGGPPGRR